MPVKINKKEIEGQPLVIIRDPKTKDVRSIATLYDLKVGVIEKKANILTSGDLKVYGSSYFADGVEGALTLPSGAPTIRAGSNVTIAKNNDGSIAISAAADVSSLTQEFAAVPGLVSSLSSQVSSLAASVSSFASSLGTITSNVSSLNSYITSTSSSLDTRVTQVSSSFATSFSNLSGSLQALDEKVSNMKGGLGVGLAMNEAPVGEKDGQNKTFKLANVPSPPSSLMVFLNGQLLTGGNGSDFITIGDEVTLSEFVPAPSSDDVVLAMYSYEVPVKSYSINEPIQPPVLSNLGYFIELANTPSPAESLMLFMNGQLLSSGAENDYTLNGKVVSLQGSLSGLTESRFFATYSY